MMMTTPALTGTTSLQQCSAARRLSQPARSRSAASPRSAVRVSALFNFLPGGSTKVVKVSPKAKQLVEELVEITEGSDIGTELRAADKEGVEALVGCCCKWPLQTPSTDPFPGRPGHPRTCQKPTFLRRLGGVDLSFAWDLSSVVDQRCIAHHTVAQVIYKTKPTGLGPDFLRNPLGKAALQDQRYYQVFDDDGTIRNVVQYKTLGLLPGEVDQGGGLEVTGGNTFKVGLDMLCGCHGKHTVVSQAHLQKAGAQPGGDLPGRDAPHHTHRPG